MTTSQFVLKSYDDFDDTSTVLGVFNSLKEAKDACPEKNPFWVKDEVVPGQITTHTSEFHVIEHCHYQY